MGRARHRVRSLAAAQALGISLYCVEPECLERLILVSTLDRRLPGPKPRRPHRRLEDRDRKNLPQGYIAKLVTTELEVAVETALPLKVLAARISERAGIRVESRRLGPYMARMECERKVVRVRRGLWALR